MRFGHLLSFLNEYIIPVVKESSPIVKIDYNMWLTKMYTLPFQVSLDPRVCIVNASSEPVNSKKFFPNLINWKYISDDLMTAYGLTMNIYINHSQILSSLEDAKNDKGDVNLFDFLNSLCTALNKAMGGINNLEPIYDEDTHTIYIIDGSYSPKNKSRYEIDLYGYDPGKKSSNFIRNFNLKTEITNEFATMATIGSTAGGYTKGVENTMFSKWNKGLQDPWKEKITPPKKAIATRGDDKEITQIYYEDFWMARYSAWGYTLKDVANDLFTSDKASLNDELIEKNLTLVTEFYKYCQSVIQSKQAEYSSPTNGFVPISLGLTMDGISGIKIYNEINVNTKFLPRNYSDSLRFIVKGVNHKLSNSDWETNIETVVISNSGDINQPPLPYWRIRQIIKEAILEGKTESQESDLPKASAPVREGSGAATRNIQLFKGSLKYSFDETVLFLTDILKELGIPNPNPSQISFMKAWRQKEGGSASYNPFNTTYISTGSSPYNSNKGFPVQNYPNRSSGIKATVNTLKSYPEIVKSIKNIKTDPDINKTMEVVNNSRWGSNFKPTNYKAWKTLNNYIFIPPIIPR